MIYSVLEQHRDGSWWYHPGYTFDTEEKAQEQAADFSKRHEGRPTTVFAHEEKLPQGYATCTEDFETFGFGGIVEWPESRFGERQ